MNQNRFWELLVKKQSGEATPEEQTELGDYLTNFNIDKNLPAAVAALWDTPVTPRNSPAPAEINAKWNQLKLQITDDNEEAVTEIHTPVINRKKIIYYSLAVAASLIGLLFLSASFLFNKTPVSTKPNKNIVSTKNGSKSKLQLPDGTTVWLNAGSKIWYNEDFNKKDRKVQLTGEAYFDVTHNKEKPFIIHTRAIDIKVLGTVFNVRAYSSDNFTEAALIKGSIEVSFPEKNAKKIILKPNEKIKVLNTIKTTGDEVAFDEEEETGAATLVKEAPPAEVTTLTIQPSDNSVTETAWALQNKLIFRSKPFSELSVDMERWFDVHIRFADTTIKDIKFTGTFSTETITEALGALQLSYHFKYKVDKNTNLITVYSK